MLPASTNGPSRELFGATPTPTTSGRGLRHAGRLLSALKVAKPSETAQLRSLLAELLALTDTVARLRQTQQRAAQAAAARAAAEQLHAAAARYARPAATPTRQASRRQTPTRFPTAVPSYPPALPAQPARGRRA
jgi:septal ring factor EnvC (AmiA/AmiB activator)